MMKIEIDFQMVKRPLTSSNTNAQQLHVPALMVYLHCVKSVRIRRISGPYSVRLLENTDQKKPKYEHFPRSVIVRYIVYLF